MAPSQVTRWIEALGRIDKRLNADTTGTTIPIIIKGSCEEPICRVDVDTVKVNWRRTIGLER